MAKKWTGIRTNMSIFQGEIVSDPVFSDNFGFLTLRTKVVQRDQNGQFVEIDQDVPLMIEPESQSTRVVKDYVRAGRKLQAWCFYKSWDHAGVLQHAFVVTKLDLGEKPFEPQDKQE